jgi:hypothetical protein
MSAKLRKKNTKIQTLENVHGLNILQEKDKKEKEERCGVGPE